MANKSKNVQSLSANIANLLNSATAGFYEDEDELDETAAKIVPYNQSDHDQNEEPIKRSKLRIQNLELLEDIDEKYAGKVSSRKRLRDSSDESEAELEHDFDSDIDKSDSEDANTSQSDIDDVEDEGSCEEAGSSSEKDDDDDTSNFKHFRDTNVVDQRSKGNCVRNQLNIWENLLETRIQLQKCVVASNRVPSGESFKEFSENSEEFKNKLSETKKLVGNILGKMISLQASLLQNNPETKKLLCEKQKNKSENEEITSDEEEVSEPVTKKPRKTQEFQEILSKRHKLYKDYRNKTIEKWNEKSRIGMLSKNNTETILNQIEHILNNRPKLIKKTQLKRSNYQILGQPETEENEIYNENIYDDEDFYHQLLRELIEFKSSDVTDSVELGRRWIRLQSMRNKMKRKIDTRATKGRKIRYAVSTKLVNFMAPFDCSGWTDEAKGKLFSSLFGKKEVYSHEK